MTELPKYGRVQIDSHRKCQNFVVKVRKLNLIKFELKWSKQWSFLINNYGKLSGEIIFYNFVKKMWLIMCQTVMYGNNIFRYLLNMIIITLC